MSSHEHDAVAESGRPHGHHNHHGFDPDHLMSMEERRNTMMAPEKVLPEFLTRNDMTLVDIGCGAGYFTIPAARILDRGRVYAVDRQQNMIDTTLKRAETAGLTNIEGIVAASTDLPLQDASIDSVLLAMVFHDIQEQSETLSEIKRVLKSGGSLYLVEWDRIDTDFGPPMELRIRPSELTERLTSAGFEIADLHTSTVQPAVYFVHARS